MSIAAIMLQRHDDVNTCKFSYLCYQIRVRVVLNGREIVIETYVVLGLAI